MMNVTDNRHNDIPPLITHIWNEAIKTTTPKSRSNEFDWAGLENRQL